MDCIRKEVNHDENFSLDNGIDKNNLNKNKTTNLKHNFSEKSIQNHKTFLNSRLEQLESLDLEKCNNFSELARNMKFTSFGGRQVGEAVDVAEAMMKDKNCFKVLTLSGAMTVAKMGLIICDMIDSGMVDAIVSTGALMAHGFIEANGFKHFKAPENISDRTLYMLNLNRIYDSLELESSLDYVADIFENIINSFDSEETLCSYKINKELGKYLVDHFEGRGILKSAYLKKVPVFIPAFTDSEFGLDFAIINKLKKLEGKKEFKFDPFLDLEEYTRLIFNAKKTGIFTIGGGVPRNWAQQVGPYIDLIRWKVVCRSDKKSYRPPENSPYYKPFSYGVRICPEPVHWGGLSGCTYSEGISWGKFLPKEKGGMFAEVLSDATIVWPIIIKAVLERLKEKKENVIKLAMKTFN